jgi:DNA-binding CsgD family transcriptional regulator
MARHVGGISAVGGHDEGVSPEVLRERAIAAGASAANDTPRALEAWGALMAGAATLVGHYREVDRCLVVLRQGRSSGRNGSLSDRERVVVSRRLVGASLREIADELDVSISTVAKNLQRALLKLNVQNIAELVALTGSRAQRDARYAAFVSNGSEYVVVSLPRPNVLLPTSLTDAERAVVAALLLGRSNGEIAESRRVALRTVANQVASIFRKLEVSSRVELIRKLSL